MTAPGAEALGTTTVLQGLAGDAGVGMALLRTTDGAVLWANAACARVLGVPDIRDVVLGIPDRTGTTTLDLADGRTVRLDLSAGTLEGEPTLLVVLHDITDERTRQAAFAAEAATDPGTGVPNKRGLRRAVETIDRHGPVTVVFVDLDRFKAINDVHGHEVGDAVLRAVAGRLDNLARDADVVARWGGDEFVLVTAGAQAGESLAARIGAVLVEPMQAGGQRIDVEASVGWASSSGGWDLDELVAEADRSMFVAKRRRRVKARLYVRDGERSARTVDLVRRHLGDRELEVIDVRDHPQRLEEDRIVVTPTLRVHGAGAVRELIGDFADVDLGEALEPSA